MLIAGSSKMTTGTSSVHHLCRSGSGQLQCRVKGKNGVAFDRRDSTNSIRTIFLYIILLQRKWTIQELATIYPSMTPLIIQKLQSKYTRRIGACNTFFVAHTGGIIPHRHCPQDGVGAAPQSTEQRNHLRTILTQHLIKNKYT